MARAHYPGVKLETLKDSLAESRQKLEVNVEDLVDDEYVRTVTGLGGSTVISGLIHGVTFSLEVPTELPGDVAAAVAFATVRGIRENVFLDLNRVPGANQVR